MRIVPTGQSAQLGPDGLSIPATSEAAAQLIQSVPPPAAPTPARGPGGVPWLGAQLDLAPTGGGTLPQRVHFTVGQLGGWPSDLNLHLQADDVPRPSQDGTRAFVRTVLNGVLLDMLAPTGNEARIERTIPMPSALLRPDNVLEIDRVYTPPNAGCAGDGVGSSGPLQGTATLAWTRYGSARSKLPEFAARLQGPGELLLAGNRPARRAWRRGCSGCSIAGARHPSCPRQLHQIDRARPRAAATSFS